MHQIPTLPPSEHHSRHRSSQRQRHDATIGDFCEAGAKQRQIQTQQANQNDHGPDARHTGLCPLHHKKRNRCHSHGSRHRDSISPRERVRRAKTQHQHDASNAKKTVQNRDVNLPSRLSACVPHIESRQIPEIHRLAGQREHPADQRLRGDDRRRRGQHHKRPAQVPLRHHEKKQIRLGRIRRSFHDHRRLPEVIQNQRGKNNQPPTRHDRLPAKVPEVGVERFRTRHCQHDRTHQRPCTPPTSRQQPRTVQRIQSLQHLRTGTDLHHTHGGQHKEPHQHHRPENPSQPARAKTLGIEKAPQNNHSQRQRIRAPLRIHTRQALHRTQHRNRWSDRPVAEEQRSSKNQQARHHPPAHSPRRTPVENPRHQRENPALAVVVSLHDQHHVFHPHH